MDSEGLAGEMSGGLGQSSREAWGQFKIFIGESGISVMEAELSITFSVKQKSMALVLLRGKSLRAFELYVRKINLETLMSTDSHGERRYGD